jgi:DNA invertase Pin-like site-specific DNA recombinase
LEAQKRDIEDYARYLCRDGAISWGGIYVDKAQSGNVPFSEREQGRELNLALRRGDHIIMAKLDRGFRRTDDLCHMMAKWHDRGITLHVLDLKLDTSSSVAAMVLQILGVVAQFERRRIGERTAAAVKIARQNGKAANGYAGYGFRYVGVKGHRRRVPDEYERAVMRRIVEWRMQGADWDEIYFHLLKHKVKNRGREWSLSRVKRAYLAELRLMAEEAGSGKLEQSPASEILGLPCVQTSRPSRAT